MLNSMDGNHRHMLFGIGNPEALNTRTCDPLLFVLLPIQGGLQILAVSAFGLQIRRSLCMYK